MYGIVTGVKGLDAFLFRKICLLLLEKLESGVGQKSDSQLLLGEKVSRLPSCRLSFFGETHSSYI